MRAKVRPTSIPRERSPCVHVVRGARLATALALGVALYAVTGMPAGAQDAGRDVSTHVIPLFPPAGDRLQGFARIINHSDRAGIVSILAIDDSGVRFGPASLWLDAKATAHFNSDDLEQGNAFKGLLDGVGDGDGNWRLEFDTDLDIEPLAYVRTADGFVTSIHDVAPEVAPGRYSVPIFNPGNNRSQVSLLRLINPTEIDADVEITGLDDRGDLLGGNVRLALPAGSARTISAQELESGGSGFSGSLADGEGRRRLSVTASEPILVMNLLICPRHLPYLSPALSCPPVSIPTVAVMRMTGSATSRHTVLSVPIRPIAAAATPHRI